MNVENLIPHALCHLDNWLHAPERLTEVSEEQLELLGAVSILTTHVEQQRIAQETRTDTAGVVAEGSVPSVPVAECCAVFIAEAMSDTLRLFSEDEDSETIVKLREALQLMRQYTLRAQAIRGDVYPITH